MNEILGKGIDGENGTPAEMEAGLLIEVDDDDLEKVAGGMSQEYLQHLKDSIKNSEVRKKPKVKASEKHKKKENHKAMY